MYTLHLAVNQTIVSSIRDIQHHRMSFYNGWLVVHVTHLNESFSCEVALIVDIDNATSAVNIIGR